MLLPVAKSHCLIDESAYPAYRVRTRDFSFDSESTASSNERHLSSAFINDLTNSILVFLTFMILILPSSYAK